MFDDVAIELPCPKCSAPLTGFQSKDGPCEMLTVTPADVANFYARCKKCDTWVEYSRWTPDIPDRAIVANGHVFELRSPSLPYDDSLRYDDCRRTTVAVTVRVPIPLPARAT